MRLEDIAGLADRIIKNVERVMVGNRETIELMTLALISGSHVLVEDVPGTGKTVMARALVKSIGARMGRIQFTPDLLPTDITGLSVFNPKTAEFTFHPGPVFVNLLLADEINRATPRTQSALLECMQERQVTLDNETRPLDAPFFVVATQNPVEIQGTFPLPEAQLDRFLMCLNMGYPTAENAVALMERFRENDPLESLESVASAAEIVEAGELTRHVYVSRPVMEYIANLAEATRTMERVSLGVSPRGMLALMRACQVLAAMRGRNHVLPDDVKHLMLPVFSHRIIWQSGMWLTDAKTGLSLRTLLDSVQVPTENIEDGGFSL